MKKIFFVALVLFISLLYSCKNQGTPANVDLSKSNFEFASSQLQYAFSCIEKAKQNESEASKQQREKQKWGELTSPRSLTKDGSLDLVPSKDWTSGFFPGELWYMYEYTKDKKWMEEARKYTDPLEREKLNKGTHDMGFKMYCSYGNGFRMTKDPAYKAILMESARTLITRYKPNAKVIRSWDFNKENWQCPVIIDNMMNLELLYWAFKESKDSTFYTIATNHAETTIKNHFRPDYSSFHVVDYDTITGDVRKKNTHQGAAHESAWARGQGWAIYGYALCYRETGKPEFLAQAKNVVNYVFTHPNMPEDLIPYWDFNAPNIPNEPRDASTASLIASALYELSTYDAQNSAQYKKWATTILTNLANSYRSEIGKTEGFLLLHSTGGKPMNSEIDVPLVYADYYFLEALLRKEKLEKGQKLF